MIQVGSEVKLSKGKRAAKYVIVGFEKPLPMFEEGGQSLLSSSVGDGYGEYFWKR